MPTNSVPSIITLDTSCTDPAIESYAAIAFSNESYSAANADANADGADTSIDRAREGYVEVFELGVVTNATVLAALRREPTQFSLPDCTHAIAVPLSSSLEIAPPTGGVSGSAYVINVLGGTLYSYDAIALDDFTRTALWSRPSSTGPTLADVNPKISRILTKDGVREPHWDPASGARSADPVSAVLMQFNVLNYFEVSYGTTAATDWIVTMPTKPLYVALDTPGAPVPLPFESNFSSVGAPDYFGPGPFSIRLSNPGNTFSYDREGNRHDNRGGYLDPTYPRLLLPWTANVLYFAQASVFGSQARVRVTPVFDQGWMRHASRPAAYRIAQLQCPPASS